ncbi:MAG: restriction endonuclease subunit S [Clostridia bacterium]|nr:restriction endonuclease subunit S [Bacteroidales bacterium]MBR3919568.1 restriction endonuclease subunit S [Clostridia bacterium]
MVSYKRLGDYIREVDVRNRDLSVTTLLGVSISKEFIPSIANTIGTDMSTYKIVRKGQFAYGPVTSRNGDKVSIALLANEDDAIISQAYTVFEVKDTNELLPKYLMMWFRRSEFDRYARFHSHGSAREIFDWSEMCDVMLPIPSIERQREIIAEYETLSKRIYLNEQMISKLEETAQTLYRKMFVDGIDKENLPEGWRMVSIFDIANVIYGYPFDSELFSNDIRLTPIIRIRDILGCKTDTYTSEKVDEKYKISDGDILIGMDGVFHMAIWNGGLAFQNQRIVRIIPHKEKFISAYQIYFSIMQPIKDLETSIEGTTVAHLSDKDMKKISVIVAPENIQKEVYCELDVLKRNVITYKKENLKLTELQSLLLAKMGQ